MWKVCTGHWEISDKLGEEPIDGVSILSNKNHHVLCILSCSCFSPSMFLYS